VHPVRQAAHRAVEGLLHDRGPCVRVGGERLEPAADLGHVAGGQQPVVVDLALGHGEQR
jgi:hypothetical protein